MSDESTNPATQEVGTTERLFGREESEASIETTTEPETESHEEPPVEARPRDEKGKFVSQKAAEPETSPNDEYLQIEALGDKKVKVKIGGEEREIPVRDLVRGYQTDQYLTQKGQRLAEEYRQLQASKANKEQPPAANVPHATVPDDDFTREYIDPKLAPYQKKVSELEAMLGTVTPFIGEMKYQSDLKKLDSTFKEQGFDDFLQYVPKIEQHILQQDLGQQQNLYSFEFFSDFYKTEKMKEMAAALKNPPKSEPKLPDQRPKPKLVNVESGGGTPTGNDDNQSLLNAAFQKAQQSGRTQDWVAYVQMKTGG